MAVRIRKDGRILCAAMHPEEPGDVYLDDAVHYRLSVEMKALVTDDKHLTNHGEWWFRSTVPIHVRISDRYSNE